MSPEQHHGTADDALRAQLAAAERGEAAAHTEYRHPRWLPLAAGTWVFAFVVAATQLDFTASSAVMLLLILLPAVYAWWDHKRLAAAPRGPAPGEFTRFYLALVVAAVLLLGLVGLAFTLDTWLGAAAAGIGCAAVGTLLHRSYERARTSSKERLG